MVASSMYGTFLVATTCFLRLLLLFSLPPLNHFFSIMTPCHARFSEEERLQAYAARNYTWPMKYHHHHDDNNNNNNNNNGFVPNTPGWASLMKRRIRQIETFPGPVQEKYDGWLLTMASSVVLPNFTQFGWAVTKVPDSDSLLLLLEIQQALYDGFDDSAAEPEFDDPGIVGQTTMIGLSDDLKEKALIELQPYFEAWIGGDTPLTPETAYGLRLYPNRSSLYMHVDKHSTHVISGIFHIDHSEDSQPWPLLIEDFEGVTQKVILEKGDILLYESAKCLHGRPIPFQGSWYTSLFLHYSPKFDWDEDVISDERHFAVPPHWREVQQQLAHEEDDDHDEPPPRLEMIDTAMLEPDCPNQWCLSEEAESHHETGTKTWEGRSKIGVAISAHGTETVLDVGSKDSKSARDDL